MVYNPPSSDPKVPTPPPTEAFTVWNDDAGNASCGVTSGSGQALGSARNPVITADGRQMVWDAARAQWSDQRESDPAKRYTAPASDYPAFPPPPPPPPPAPPERKQPYQLSDAKWGRIAARRLAMQRGTEGFGNARSVRLLLLLCPPALCDRTWRRRRRT